MNLKPIKLLFQLSRPFFLLSGALFYALGVGIARYLGFSIDWNLYFIGQLWVSAMQLATHYLNEYFDGPNDKSNHNRTPFSGGSGVLGEETGQLDPRVALLAAAAMLTTVALTTFGLGRAGVLGPVVGTILALTFFGAFFYSVPPVRLSASGFGELTASFILANLVPALGFALQSGELHRLLAMSTFPLTALSMAAMLAFELPDFASDLKVGKRTLLVRLDWRQGMQAHNAFIVAAYLLLLVAYLMGLPAAIAFPPLFTFPLGLLQIWYLHRIREGIKPNWTALTLNAVMLVGAVSYLLTYTFWTR
ncbi:MAG: prenyltransferase [Chloroflexi bacterium]|nr:prenyltransferase [Chloroflexota bacterium]